MKKKSFILLMLLTLLYSLIFTTSCTQSSQKEQTSSQSKESSIFETGEIDKIKITAPQANVKSGCSNNFPTTGTLDKNDKVDVVGKVKDWYVIQLPNNKVGAVSENDCKPVVVEDKNETTPKEQLYLEEQPNLNNELTTQEQQMLRLVNDARAKNNLKPLQVDFEVTKLARLKSQDMIDNDYFSHYSPTYGSPFDMMKKYGVEYVYAGENLAANSTVQRAHDALMKSPGHRENILKPEFTHIGIGIKEGGPSGLMFTQMFISKPE